MRGMGAEWEKWEVREAEANTSHCYRLLALISSVPGRVKLLQRQVWRAALLLLASMPVLVQEKCSCSWTEQHFPWLMPAQLLVQTFCQSWDCCSVHEAGHPALHHICLHFWATSTAGQEPPACFLLPWLVLPLCFYLFILFFFPSSRNRWEN